MTSREDLRELAAVLGAISFSLDRDVIARTAVERTAALTGADSCVLVLPGAEDAAWIAASTGTQADQAGRLLALAVDDLTPERLRTHLQIGADESLLTSPVPIGGDERGLLGVCGGWRSGRRPDGEIIIGAIARQAGLALANARLYREAKEAGEANDQLLAEAAHELRGPLAALLAGIEVLDRCIPEGERARQMLAILDRNARLHARLLDDLLDLSRIALGKIRFQRVPVRLASVVESAAQSRQSDMARAGLSLHLSLDRNVWVLGDPARLQQVVANLLGRAGMFIPGGRIAVVVREDGAKARLVVEETGSGPASSSLEGISVALHPEEAGARPGAEPRLGLSLVRSIAEGHGGRLREESGGPGFESRLTMELPAVPAPPPPAGALG